MLKKPNTAEKPTEIHQKRTKEKIQNAINLLRLEGKEITTYSISKTAGVLKLREELIRLKEERII